MDNWEFTEIHGRAQQQNGDWTESMKLKIDEIYSNRKS